jgi:hypothetical protein
LTVIVKPLAAESVTVKVADVVPLLPSVTVTSLIDSEDAASLSLMVPWPWLSRMTALTAFERFTKNVSLGSSMVSPLTSTVIVFARSPGLKVNVPAFA